MKMFDRENISFFISTNGSPLVQKHVDFFKTLKARVEMAISHDGPGQEALRGEDILKRPNKVATIKQLYDLQPKVSFSFNSVISANNYDLFAINKYFKDFADANDMPNTKLTFIPIRNYDDTNSQNSAEHVIRGDDLAKFDAVVKAYIDQYINDVLTDTKTMLRSSMMDGPLGVFDCIKSLRHQVPVTVTSRCGSDCSDILSVDVQGNAKLCPHTHEKFDAGKLNNIKGIKVTRLDLDRKNTHCYHCPVKRLCKSSCPIKLPSEVFLMNCAVEKIWYGNIQRGAFRMLFGQEVEMLEVNTTPGKIRHNHNGLSHLDYGIQSLR
jgi:radical SAM protein with 4Fe4S-binding SPASM domain